MEEKRQADNNPSPSPDLSDDEYLEEVHDAASAKKAFLARPPLSLRLQFILYFLLAFLFSVGIAVMIIMDIYEVEKKITGLEIVNDYVIEIDQARRFEKNFFLYKTNLSDALESVDNAKVILVGNQEDLKKIIGDKKYKETIDNINSYEELLESLRSADTQSGQRPDKTIENRLRKQGQKMIFLAQDLMKKERSAMDRAIARSRNTQIYSLIFLLIIMIATAYFLGGRMLRNIRRFESYALRIAEGDFELITPKRRYRDEFTNLAIAINHMVQELEKHESMLVQSHKMRAIGTLTAGVAHELNNPLNNITLTSHMLLEDFQDLDDEERKQMIDEVTEEAERAKKIVSNLLDFTRESETKLEPLDLVQLVKGTIDLAANQTRIAGMKIEFHATDNLHRIQGDSQQLRQVFLNLILNAIAASSKGAKIQIMASPADDPDHVAVKVIDHGVGIPRHYLSSIFDPFFTTKDRGKGTGLGLSVSQGIIAKHGGRIRVDSRMGHGSTFTVILPVTTIL
ncbi:MAG: HAMP domain-containing sensor histidine kinase [Myxococcota bacterium]|nr:HAMP domain-containing sensor histidine kinase [Myxococcota bacterium]